MAEKIGLLKRIFRNDNCRRIFILGKVTLAIALVLLVPIGVVGIVMMTEGPLAFALSVGWVALAIIIGDKLEACDRLKRLSTITNLIIESRRWQGPKPPGWFSLALRLMRIALIIGLGLAFLLGVWEIVLKFDPLALGLSIYSIIQSVGSIILGLGWLILGVGWTILTALLLCRIMRSSPSTST